MTEKEYLKALATGQELLVKHAQERSVFRQHTLLVASSLFGVLIALHSKDFDSNLHLLCFAIANSLLALGILMNAIALYEDVSSLSLARKYFASEAQNAFHEHRSSDVVISPSKKIFAICGGIGNVLYLLSVLMLAFYTALPLFYL